MAIPLSTVVGTILIVAVAIDSFQRIAYLWRFEWFVSLMKWVKWLVGAAAGFGSVAMAKQLTHLLTHVDPKFFPEFVYLVGAAFFPIALIAVISLFLSILGFMQGIGMLLALLAQMMTYFLRNTTSPLAKLSEKDIFGRLLRGKKPKQGLNDSLWSSVHVVLRPLGTLALSALVVQLLEVAPVIYANLPDHYVRVALMTVEFRPDHRCQGVPSTTPVAYLDRGNVLLPIVKGGREDFDVRACIYASQSSTVASVTLGNDSFAKRSEQSNHYSDQVITN
ncbi:MAG: hypothetical protein JO142_13355 [Burkholderiales bacterium]|nr:hypothetical protein [Burkholderiales bacterium]